MSDFAYRIGVYLKSYLSTQVISCDQSLNRCCELIELTAKIQGQLFAILNLTSAEGKHRICSIVFCCILSINILSKHTYN